MKIIKRETEKLIKHKKIVGPILVLAFFVGLAAALYIFNKEHSAKYILRDVNFVDPHQAVVFWKTKEAEVGYVSYGTNAINLNRIAEQTSSRPGLIHVVVIDDIPLDGVYVSFHSQGESNFLWSNPFKIMYEESDNGE